MSSPPRTVSIVIVGCGAPLRSMGWYHATQILDGRIPHATLKHIVDPYFMSDVSRGQPGHEAFHRWRRDLSETRGVTFHSSVTGVPPPSSNDDDVRLAIISARTVDNPPLFAACCNSGDYGAIFLEKPGAPSVLQLREMKDLADSKNVAVYMGFNKNVSTYVSRARSFSSASPTTLTFLHNNAYENTAKELSECFERNAEGMLKNMAIHELALLVTFYGVTVDSIADVTADKSFSRCQSLVGPSSGRTFVDFDKLCFTVVTTGGERVTVAADRCGGDDSVSIVNDAASGEELARFSMPDEDALANVPGLEAKYPGAMPYFFAQDMDYAEVKRRVVEFLARGDGEGNDGPEGVATIDVAIETLKVAEYLTPILQGQLLDKE